MNEILDFPSTLKRIQETETTVYRAAYALAARQALADARRALGAGAYTLAVQWCDAAKDLAG